jgi:hypothetical protein
VCWRAGDAAAEFWELRSGAPPSRRLISLRPGVSLALHSFEGEAAEMVERYAGAFAALPPEELLEDLAAALPPGVTGSLAVLRTVTSDE